MNPKSLRGHRKKLFLFFVFEIIGFSGWYIFYVRFPLLASHQEVWHFDGRMGRIASVTNQWC
jgi:hypothetical protein